MKPYALLYIAAGWIIFVALLALPRGLKAVLVILGGIFVLVIAYGMHQKVRHKYLRKGDQKSDSSPEPVKKEEVTDSVSEISEEPVPAEMESENLDQEGSSHEKVA